MLAIGYSHKMVGIMFQVDGQGYVLTADFVNAEKLLTAVDNLLLYGDDYCQFLQGRSSQAKESAKETLRAIIGLLFAGL